MTSRLRRFALPAIVAAAALAVPATYGDRGRGEWITTYANSGHGYLVVAGLRLDTSARKETGTSWSDEMRSPRGYVRRHPEGF